MTEGPTDGTPTDGTESHDPDFPEAFLRVHAHGLAGHARCGRRPGPRRPTTPSAGPRCRRPFPGETLVIPTGREKVRANDTALPVPARAATSSA